jgi:hypothetical protein
MKNCQKTIKHILIQCNNIIPKENKWKNINMNPKALNLHATIKLHMHSIQRGPAGISSWTRIWWAPKNARRATGSSASHHPTPPAHDPPQTSSGSMPRLPGYICAQQPQEGHTRISPLRHNTPLLGALSCPVMEREDNATPRTHRPVTVSTNRVKPAYMLNETDHGTTTFNPAVDTTQPQHCLPRCHHPSHELHAPDATYSTFPCSLQHLNDHLRRRVGVMWEPPTLNQALQQQHISGKIVAIIARKHSLLCNNSIIRYPWKQFSTTQEQNSRTRCSLYSQNKIT